MPRIDRWPQVIAKILQEGDCREAQRDAGRGTQPAFAGCDHGGGHGRDVRALGKPRNGVSPQHPEGPSLPTLCLTWRDPVHTPGLRT